MMGVGFPSFGAGPGQLTMNPAGYVPSDNCSRCGYAGCDVRVTTCGCTMHTRCTPLKAEAPLTACPHCNHPTSGIVLVPMSFREMDEARKTAAALASHGGGKHGKKRKSTMDSAGMPMDKEKASEDSDQRTGRWTAAETSYVDYLIAKFEDGSLPLVDGIKLNDFLAGMLQCKQSRLTKKMKNAKLSSKCFKRVTGYIVDTNDAREFSVLEEAFFHSIHCHEERAEIKFHMQKQWRELFSSYCVSLGQPLDADGWLNSVEEIERRASMAKDAARMVRRKLMMGKAFNQDCMNPDRGVIIDRSDSFFPAGPDGKPSSFGPGGAQANTDSDEFLSMMTEKTILHELNPGGLGTHSTLGASAGVPKNLSPYLDKVISYLQRSSIPFEHVDAWVPSFVPTTGAAEAQQQTSANPKCRLCFAGCATVEMQVPKGSRAAPMLPEEHFNLISFGEYSQKFSFDIGCGLPGRVYQSGIPTWEQSVHNAPLEHFERCGGAVQCGIRTVVGIPVPSPNVGRIVVVLYSCHDREKDQELVGRLCEEFTRLLPTPRWKLIVDLGHPSENSQQKDTSSSAVGAQSGQASAGNSAAVDVKDSRIDQVVSLLGEHMPSDTTSPLASYLPGFMSLRLLMLRTSRSEQENELVRTMLDSYSSYTATGRAPSDIALLLARDCMFMSQQANGPTSQPQQQAVQQHQHQALPPIPMSTSTTNLQSATHQSHQVAPQQQQQGPATNSYIHHPPPAQAAPAPTAMHGGGQSWQSSNFMPSVSYQPPAGAPQAAMNQQAPPPHPGYSMDQMSRGKSDTNGHTSAPQDMRRPHSSSDHRNVSE